MDKMLSARRISSTKTLLLALTLGALSASAAELTPAQIERLASLDTPKIPALRQAITYLQTTYGPRYPKAGEFLARLETLEKSPDSAALAALQREALLANPLICAQPLMFVARQQYMGDHHNTETMFQTGEINTFKFKGGGVIKLLDLAQGGKITTLVDAGPEGLARDPEVSFDGGKIVFSMRKNIKDDYHIYEINADGTGLKQLTRTPGVFDIDPLYLPDNSIVFSSSREPKFCMCNRHIMGNLYRMESDGANIVQIGKNTLFEGHPTLLSDGRILYDRWEYQDRNFGDAQGLWSMNPDGTSHTIFYKNNTGSPGAAIQARAVPGSTWAVCTFSSCHDRPWGAIALIDRDKGVDGRAPVLQTWPADAVNLVKENGSFDAFKSVFPKYEDPYPLSDKFILASRMVGKGEQMGLVLLDVFGNELLVHTEEPGCFDPMPLSPRVRPAVIPTRQDFRADTGTFYIQNVYDGTHMKGVTPGSIKYLRVVEQGEKRSWCSPAWPGQGTQSPGMAWHDFANKRILGTVPVEADGSAKFEVPARKFVYFQLLDENKKMIQSMRSGTTIQSGETQGCIGCHEDRHSAPVPASKVAMTRAASQLDGWFGAPRFFNYRTEVQPVFDQHCVKCHDANQNPETKVNLAGDRGVIFNRSYVELWSKNIIKVVGAGPAPTQEAYSWGSHASPLTKTLETSHHGVKLSEEERQRVITWMDLNAPYYPSYFSAYPENLYGRSPLDNAQIKRLADLGIAFKNKNLAAQISFDRPELSPCLSLFKDHSDAKYLEALAIIQAGREMLLKKPEADDPAFVASAHDLARDQKYEALRKVDLAVRQAIVGGSKVYDPPVGQ